MIHVDEWSFRCAKCDWTPNRDSTIPARVQTRMHIDGHNDDQPRDSRAGSEAAARRPQLDKIRRYDLVTNYRCGSSIEEMERADEGEWVRFEDVEAFIGAAGGAGRSPEEPT